MPVLCVAHSFKLLPFFKLTQRMRPGRYGQQYAAYAAYPPPAGGAAPPAAAYPGYPPPPPRFLNVLKKIRRVALGITRRSVSPECVWLVQHPAPCTPHPVYCCLRTAVRVPPLLPSISVFELTDTKYNALEIQARLGTTAYFCKVVVAVLTG